MKEEESDESTLPESNESATITPQSLLAEKSKKHYQKAYEQFIKWKVKKQAPSFSERVILEYFSDLSEKYKCSTLWTYYSMLRSMLRVYHNINLESYTKLRSFLKRKSQNYEPKKAKTLSPEQIKQFIIEAPDIKYLATKVAMIMGIMGACRSNELYAMELEHLEDLNDAYFVTVPNKKITRKFTVTENFYDICKRYINSRPANAVSKTLFLNYQKGKCTIQRIGINKFGGMPKEVATFLKLPNFHLYTGHSFRRSSASLVDDGDIIYLKRQGGWQSRARAESYIDKNIINKNKTARIIIQQMNASNLTEPTASYSSIPASSQILTSTEIEFPSHFTPTETPKSELVSNLEPIKQETESSNNFSEEFCNEDYIKTEIPDFATDDPLSQSCSSSPARTVQNSNECHGAIVVKTEYEEIDFEIEGKQYAEKLKSLLPEQRSIVRTLVADILNQAEMNLLTSDLKIH